MSLANLVSACMWASSFAAILKQEVHTIHTTHKAASGKNFNAKEAVQSAKDL
jgi:hypothetical protein